MKRVLLATAAVLAAFAAGCGGASAASTDNVVLRWNDAALQAVRDNKPGPPMTARANAIVHTCIFDAWALYDDKAVGTQQGIVERRPVLERTPENKAKAISYAAYRALTDLYLQPASQAKFRALMLELGYDPDDASTDPATPEGAGNLCAQLVTDFRHIDGSNQLGDLNPGPYSDYTGYVPVNSPDTIVDPNRWQPLRIPDGKGGFIVQTFVAPHWSAVIPFALTSGSQFRPKVTLPLYSPLQCRNWWELVQTLRYMAQAHDIVDISARLTDRQKMVAEYWADGPSTEFPPGHWCLIGQYVSHRDGHTLDEDAKMFFALTNAVMDAGIAAWDCKRAFDYVRPVTAVHFVYGGKKIRAWGGPYQGTKLIKGEDWQPYQAPNVVTPAFPEFVSGHSTFSAAGAEILKRFTRSDAYGASVTFPKGSSLFESGQVPARSIKLSWPTFTAAADEAGISRLYGGIHFRDGDVYGRSLGRKVGAAAWKKAQKYIDGTAYSSRGGPEEDRDGWGREQ